MNEEEKRLHRCCFSGHRPEKLEEPEAEVKQWLAERIEEAIRAGYTTFISGTEVKRLLPVRGAATGSKSYMRIQFLRLWK